MQSLQEQVWRNQTDNQKQ